MTEQDAPPILGETGRREVEGVNHPSLSPLELRLERSKRLGNLELDYIKRLYDGRPIGELYASGEFDLHVHFTTPRMGCAMYRALDTLEIGACGPSVGDCAEVPLDLREFPVFVPIGKGSESFRPVASVVRLQSLDCCDMSGIDALKFGLGASREIIFRFFNWKLRSLLRRSGIVLGEFKDEIIESALEVVTNFADQNPDTHGRHRIVWSRSDEERIRRIRIELPHDGIFLSLVEFGENAPQIGNMFLCPRYSFETGVEFVRGKFDHD